MQGQLDIVTSSGIVEGWCWNENAPDERVTVLVRVDGSEAVRTVASLYREDLRDAGIGDGFHFFRCVLPLDALGRNRAAVLTLCDANTGETVGDPYTMRSDQTLSFDDRLAMLESQARLLEGRLAEISQPRRGNSGQAELFAVIGAFFERLSHDLARGLAPTAEQQLTETVQAVLQTYPTMYFPPAEPAAISVVVTAAHPLATLYKCLAAIRCTKAAPALRVTVLDMGGAVETALVPSLTRGIRYIRATAEQVAEWNEATRGDTAPILLALSGAVELDPGFLEQINVCFEADPGLGAVGACIADPDHVSRRGGMRVVNGVLVDIAATTTGLPLRAPEPVDAVTPGAVAFRRVALEAVGGMDQAFGEDLDAAVIDLCFRLRQAGWSVAFHPGAIASSSELAEGPAPPHRSPGWDLLQERWLGTPNREQAPMKAGF